MQLKGANKFGIFLILIGIFFLLNASSSITGLIIAEEISAGASSILGIVFIAVGIALFSYREGESYEIRESKLRSILGNYRYEKLSEKDRIAYNKAYRRHLEAEERREYKNRNSSSDHATENHLHVVRTDQFERATRGHDEGAIERAINKIGTGLGKEEKLKHLPGHSIRVSKGGRIIYDKKKDGTIELRDYLPSHNYARSKNH